MPLTVGTDSYVTLVEADAYAAARPSLSTWAGLSEPVREAALKDATLYLENSYEWIGTLADVSQALSWPRLEAYDRNGRHITTIPQAIRSAQIELAFIGASAPLVDSRTTGNVSAIKAGQVDIKFVNGQNVNEGEKYAPVDRLLSGLFTARAGVRSVNARLTRG